MKRDYKYEHVEFKWKYITDLYNTDKVMSFRIAPKLTDKHITLSPFTALTVNLAAQVLSHSVHAGINTLCALNHLRGEASTNAEFIGALDQLFNALNSTSIISSHKYKRALKDKSGILNFLTVASDFCQK